jgi:hypothetical protein
MDEVKLAVNTMASVAHAAINGIATAHSGVVSAAVIQNSHDAIDEQVERLNSAGEHEEPAAPAVVWPAPEIVTLRDYFAMHAPAEIQTWFDFVEPTYTGTQKPKIGSIPEDDRQDAACWLSDPCFDLDEERPHLKAFCDQARAYWNESRAWISEVAKLKNVAWRWAYADAMLASRGK